MLEVTLVGKARDIGFFLELKEELKSIFSDDIIIVISFNNDLICSMALSNKNEGIFKKYIYETIIKIAKSEYYEANLNIFCEDKNLNTFILSSLLMVNLSDELEYSMELTDISKLVNIRSFVNFKLHKLIELWSREIEYYNHKFCHKDKSDLYLEFLRFLANNSNSKQEIMYIESLNEKMILLDKKKKEIKSVSKNDEIGIIVNLVMFAPKKIIINCMDRLSNKVSNLISYIFEDKVSILL